MRRGVVGLVGLVMVLALAGCGGPPSFVPGPGKVRASPIPHGHGEVNYPANVTVDGTGLFIFTHGVRPFGDVYQVNLSAVPDPTGARPGDNAVQAWLGKGESMRVAGLTVTVLEVYPGQGEAGSADVQVSKASGDSATTTAGTP